MRLAHAFTILIRVESFCLLECAVKRCTSLVLTASPACMVFSCAWLIRPHRFVQRRAVQACSAGARGCTAGPRCAVDRTTEECESTRHHALLRAYPPPEAAPDHVLSNPPSDLDTGLWTLKTPIILADTLCWPFKSLIFWVLWFFKHSLCIRNYDLTPVLQGSTLSVDSSYLVPCFSNWFVYNGAFKCSI